jgi:ferredoxin
VERAGRGSATSVTIDPDLCMGSGECVRVAPAAFRLDETRGVSVPLPGAPSVDPALLAEAALGCPTRAIRVGGAGDG